MHNPCEHVFFTGIVKQPWDIRERAAMEKHFGAQLLAHTIPSKESIEACLLVEPEILCRRKWKTVKDYCRNKITAMKRRMDDNDN
jgi:hypothetical protein